MTANERPTFPECIKSLEVCHLLICQFFFFTTTWLIFGRALHSKHSWEDVACSEPSSPHNRTRDLVFLLYSKTLQILHLDSLQLVVSISPLLIVYARTYSQYVSGVI